MVVTFDQESCLLYKAALDQHLPPEASEIVISVSGKEREDERYRPYKRGRDAEEKLLDRFRDPNDPLQILVVTAKLLTGFDAPILQAMYLDKPMRDHTLLQAITRTNRTYGDRKTHGLIVDYLGVFDDVAKSLEFDEEGFRQVVSDIANLKDQAARSHAEMPGLLPGRGPHRQRLRGPDRRPGVPAQQRSARRLRRRLQLPLQALGSALARPHPAGIRDRLPLAVAGLRLRAAHHRHRAS